MKTFSLPALLCVFIISSEAFARQSWNDLDLENPHPFFNLIYRLKYTKHVSKDSKIITFETQRHVEVATNVFDQIPASHTWDTSSLPVKNQKHCGSCTCFSAEIIDCGAPRDICTHGWNKENALEYIKSHGLGYTKDEPYQAIVTGHCARRKRSEVKVTEIIRMAIGEPALKEALYQYGPLAISIRVDSNLHHYMAGVYHARSCYFSDSRTNHAVVLVGYGSMNGTDYWLIRNSWGPGWGDKGYFRLKRGDHSCNVGKTFSYSVKIH